MRECWSDSEVVMRVVMRVVSVKQVMIFPCSLSCFFPFGGNAQAGERPIQKKSGEATTELLAGEDGELSPGKGRRDREINEGNSLSDSILLPTISEGSLYSINSSIKLEFHPLSLTMTKFI